MLYFIVNIFTDFVKRCSNLVIRKAKYLYPLFFKNLGAPIIIFSAVIFIVLRTVYLNCYFRAVAIEVQNIIADNFLSLKFQRMLSQKIIPQMIFLRGGALS